MPKPDADRGYMMSKHPSGVEVYMYLDDPGVYINAFGSEVTEELAQGAGFNIEKWGKLRKRNVRMAQAKAMIDAEIAMDEDEKKVVKVINDFQLIRLPGERYQIIDPDGNILAPNLPGKEMAEKVYIAIAFDNDAKAIKAYVAEQAKEAA